MTGTGVTDEYQRMNSKDQKTVRHWIVANIVLQVVAIFALIAVTSLFSERNANSVTAESPGVKVHAEAR